MISLRTLINTTIFWFLAVIVFWGYTRWIDATPAKELLYTIGWADLGNLTISNNETFGITNETQLLQKIDNMEKMIQATNMSCALLQLNTGTPNIGLNNITPKTESPATQNITVPVFDSIMNSQLPASEQGTSKALRVVQRSIVSTNPTIPEIFELISGINLTSQEQAQGLVDVFAGSQITLGQYTLNNGILTLPLVGSESLSSAQIQIISSILEITYKQFPQITTVIVQQA